jgi:hypothetical protein
MSAKHRNHAPKRRRSTSDLERRVRRLERSYLREAKSLAHHVARVEIDEAMCEHIMDKHGEESSDHRPVREPDLRYVMEVAKHAPPN